MYELTDEDDDSDIILQNYREKRSKILNFIDITVISMSDSDFKVHFRLNRRTVEVIIHSMLYYLYLYIYCFFLLISFYCNTYMRH